MLAFYKHSAPTEQSTSDHVFGISKFFQIIQPSTWLLCGWCWQHLQMIFRYSFFAKCDVALCANEASVCFLLIDFVIKNATIVSCRGDMTSFRSAARPNRNSKGFHVERIKGRNVVTVGANHVGMIATFMSEGSRGQPSTPLTKCHLVGCH